jgi:hypothetical protein
VAKRNYYPLATVANKKKSTANTVRHKLSNYPDVAWVIISFSHTQFQLATLNINKEYKTVEVQNFII